MPWTRFHGEKRCACCGEAIPAGSAVYVTRYGHVYAGNCGIRMLREPMPDLPPLEPAPARVVESAAAFSRFHRGVARQLPLSIDVRQRQAGERDE